MFRQAPTVTSINNIKSADLAKLTATFTKLVLKTGFINNHIWFNTSCKKYGVLPQYTRFRVKTKSPEGMKAIQQARATWRNLATRRLYVERNNLYLHLKVAHTELAHRLHSIEFDLVDNAARTKQRLVCHEQYLKQRSKLNQLISNKIKSTQPQEHQQTFYPRLRNLTETEFTPEEENLLNQGLKYSPPISMTPKIVIDLATDIDTAIKSESVQIKSVCAVELRRSSLNNSGMFHSRSVPRTLSSIKNKLEQNDLVLCKADKGNTCTIITKTDYNTKIQSFILESNPTVEKRDPTIKFKKDVNDCVKDCPIAFPSNTWKYKNMNPSAPSLYGLPKLHKPNIPIRPIVSYRNAPAYKLCQAFIRLFTEATGFISPYSVKNSVDLVTKITDYNIPSNAKLVSFDVVNLFTSIPIVILTDIIHNMIDNKVTDVLYREELKRIYGTCIKQNYFCYDNTFYTFSDGLPNGSPLSPLLAEIFMSFFEKLLHSDNNPYKTNIKFWYRYVDDILCLWTGTDRQLNGFLNYLNSQYSSIKFTIERETDNSINYLDLNISKINNRLEFKIYRKPTYSDAIIPAHSNHPINTKLSALHSMIERLIKIPLNDNNFNTELKTIITIAQNNGYDQKIVKRILWRKQQKSAINLIFPAEPKEFKEWRRMRYVGKTSQRLGNLINRHTKYNIAFYNKHTIHNLLVNNKQKQDPSTKSGVYSLNCLDCNCRYIGQTGRNFKTRIKEHFDAYRLGKDESTFANHLIEANHNSRSDNYSILHIQQKGHKLNALESFEIRRALANDQNILNDQTDIQFSPLTDPHFLFNNH